MTNDLHLVTASISPCKSEAVSLKQAFENRPKDTGQSPVRGRNKKAHASGEGHMGSESSISQKISSSARSISEAKKKHTHDISRNNLKYRAWLCQAPLSDINDLSLFVISISAAFQLPNNGGFVTFDENPQNFK